MSPTIRIDELGASRVSEAVILALVRVDDVDPPGVPPLRQSVNTVALDSIFEDDSLTGCITFQYEGYEITVTSDGDITVTQ